ncbi:MAG: undecaprenyl-phosphate glucose phosphotransferase [Myxococcales bacterium]|nr:undecaprenyl-phosphate glucose phosphotransferase [Myxococcales bacterium]
MKKSTGGMVRPYESELSFAARLVDLGLIGLALWLSTIVQLERWDNVESLAAMAAVVLFYGCSHTMRLYRGYRGTPLLVELRNLWLTWVSVFFLLVFLAFITKTSADHSRRVSITWMLLAPSLMSVWRLLLEFITHEARARGFNSRSAAIVGVSTIGARLAQRITKSSWMGLRLAGFYDDRSLARLKPEVGFDYEVKGGFEKLVEAARAGEVDIVYIALPPRAEPRTAELIRRLADTTASVYLAYDFGGFDLLRARWSSVGEIPVMSVVENPFYGTDGFLKRLEDLVLGTLISCLIALPMLVIALGVKLTSPGPVFFRQRRYGINGEEIRVLKFRTMTVCEDGPSVVQARQGDQRITRFGAFLRRTSLDELPQFLQVITGEMSVVGPRPHAVAHNEQYRSLIQGYMLRHKVKPGITGWAQVNGWRGETDTLEKMEKRVEYDLDYIRNWTLGLDLQIVVMTVRQVFGHQNAY